MRELYDGHRPRVTRRELVDQVPPGASCYSPTEARVTSGSALAIGGGS